MNSRTVSFALLLIVSGCSGDNDQPKLEITPPPAQAKVSAISAPDEEPSEEVLRKLEFQVYDAFDKAGDAAMTRQTSAQRTTTVPLNAKLYEVHKDKCTPSPLGDGSWYECELTIRLSLNGSAPSEQGGRIGVKWDSAKGAWELQ